MKSLLIISISISMALLSGYTTTVLADKTITFCDCVNKPIITDEKHAACSKMIESMGPEKSAVESRSCRNNLPVPTGGADICFCLKYRGKDPSLRKTCQATLEKLPENQFISKSRKCAQQTYK